MIRRNHFCFYLILLCIFLAVFSMGGGAGRFAVPSAQAEDGRELLLIGMNAKPAEMVEPDDVMLNFIIENTSAVDAQNVYLSSADGLLSEPLGRVAAGETQSFNRQHSVTQEELDAGKITYIISHDDPFDPEVKVNYTVSAQIYRGDRLPQAEFSRQFSSRSVKTGDTLIVTYRIRNTGNVALTNLRVQDTLGDFTGRVEQLGVGESRTLISRVTITEESASAAVLDYKAASSDDIYTCALADMPITIAHPSLEIQFSAGYSAFSNSVADVVLLMINTGNVDLRNVTVVDELYGGVIADSITVPAGGDPVEVSHAYPVRGDQGFRWRISGVDASGEKFELLTDPAPLSPKESDKPALLTISADTQTPRIRRSGDVSIAVRIANQGGTDARDVVLYEAEAGALRRYEIIPADGFVERSFTFRVEEDSEFDFSLSYTDADAQLQTASCLPLQVIIASDGVLPEGASSGFIEFTGNSIKIGGSSTFAVLLIAGFAVLLILIVMLLIASRRARLEKQIRIAAEKQRRREGMGKNGRLASARVSKNKGKGRT